MINKSRRVGRRTITVSNTTKQNKICTQATVANTFRTRLFGLLGKKSLDPESGLLITPSSGVHTFGMSMPIDIVCLDRAGRVLQTHSNVGPWAVRGLSLKTRSVLELAAGRIEACQIECGDALCYE